MKISATIAAVQFEERTLRAAIVRTGGKAPALLAAHCIPLDYESAEGHPQAMAAAAAELAERVKQPVSAWVLCASSAYSVSRRLRLPFKNAARIAAVVPGELEPNLAMSIEELAVDHNIVRESGGETEVLAVALRRTVVDEQITALEEAGIALAGVTFDAAALTSLWHRQTKKAPAQLEGVLHLGDKGCMFVIVYGRALAFYRHLPLMAAELAADPDRAIHEIDNSLRSFFAQWREGDELARLTVTGALPGDEVVGAFAEAFECPVEHADLLAGVKGIDAALEAESAAPEAGASDDAFFRPRAAPSAYGELIGSAVSATGGAFAFNFHQGGSLAGAGSPSGLLSHVAFTGALLLLAMAGYALYLYADYNRMQQETRLIGEQIRGIYTECFPESPLPYELSEDPAGEETYQQLLARAQMIESPLEGVPVEWFSKPLLLDVLLELSELLPSDQMEVNQLAIRPGRTGPTVEVTVDVDQSNLNAFYAAVDELQEQSETLHDVDTKISSQGAQATFVISASY